MKAFFYDPFKASPRYLFTAGGVGDWCCTIRSVRSRKGNGPYWIPVSAGKLIQDPESTEFNARPRPQAENIPEEVKRTALELYANRRRLELYCDRSPYAVWTALKALDKEAKRRGFAQPLFAFVRDFTLYSEYTNADLDKLVLERKL